LQDLKDLCKHLSVEDNVDFKVNIPFDELKTEMAESLIGIHSMWNEHFGIGKSSSLGRTFDQ
jgi:alpha-1,2-mannosyltransferase